MEQPQPLSLSSSLLVLGPLSLGLQLLSVSATYGADHPKLFAGMIIFVVPILVIYFLLKDRITEGLTIGAIKG